MKNFSFILEKIAPFKKDENVYLVEIDRELASSMLEFNTRNRKPSFSNIKRYANDMKNGKWKYEATPIRFSKEGNLIDGQNRLMAVTECGLSLPFLVITNLEADAFDVIDTGKMRSASDVLSIDDKEYPILKASISKSIMRYKGMEISNATVLQFNKENEMLHDIVVAIGRGARKFKYIIPSLLGSCYYLFAEKNYEKATEFITNLISGAGLEENNPIFVARKKLELNFGKKISEKDIKFILITAWNLYVKDKKCKEIRIMNGSKMPEIEG